MKKVLFYAVFAIITFIVTLTLLAQRLSDTYLIEHDTAINAPFAVVYNEVGDLKNWADWLPWKKHDPSVEMIFNGDKTKNVGDSYSWKSAKSGSGKLTLTENSPLTLVSYTMQFDGWSGTPTGAFRLIQMPDAVKVVWSMQGTRGFIDKIFWTLFKMEDSINADFVDGLKFLKEVSEAKKDSMPAVKETTSTDVKEETSSTDVPKKKKKKKKK